MPIRSFFTPRAFRHLYRKFFSGVANERVIYIRSPGCLVSPSSDGSRRLGGTAAMRRAAALREMGVNIAVDNFGTGYSSLGYLAKLTVNALKIDRAFVATMTSDAHSMTLVSGIISLARALDLKYPCAIS